MLACARVSFGKKLTQKTYIYLTTENAENTEGLACALNVSCFFEVGQQQLQFKSNSAPIQVQLGIGNLLSLLCLYIYDSYVQILLYSLTNKISEEVYSSLICIAHIRECYLFISGCAHFGIFMGLLYSVNNIYSHSKCIYNSEEGSYTWIYESILNTRDIRFT